MLVDVGALARGSTASAASAAALAAAAAAADAEGAEEEEGGEDGGDNEDEDDDDDDDDGDAGAGTASGHGGVVGAGAASASWGFGGRKLVRPIFRSKEQRTTIREAEERAAEEARAKEEAKRLAALRAEESRRMVAETLLREDEAAASAAAEESAFDRLRPDDTDRPEEAEADFEEWRLREMRRLKRETDAAAATVLDAAETARRRALSPEQREREDRELEASGAKVFFSKAKEKWAFMQKYAHRGAFYVDESSVAAGDVRARSIAAPSELEAGFDKSKLPSVMQVRGQMFGKKGQTRYKGLAATDTSSTRGDALYSGGGGALQRRLDAARGGMGDLDTRRGGR